MLTWIERDFTRTDVADIDEAKSWLRQLWRGAVFCDPIELDGQTITHVHERPRRFHEATKGPDAVIVEGSDE